MAADYKNCFEHAADALLVVDSQGILIESNAQARLRMGIQADAPGPLYIDDLLAPANMSQLPDLTGLRPGGEGVVFEAGLLCSGRPATPMEINLSALPGRERLFLAVCRDVAARNLAEQELKSQLHFSRTLLETIPYPVFFKGRNGVYQGGNNAYAALFGLTPDQLPGKTSFDLFPEETAAEHLKRDEILFQTPGVQVYETDIHTATGDVRQAIVNKATYSDVDGNVAGLVGVMVDITILKKVEEALRQAEGNYRRIFENAVYGIFQSTLEGRFIRINPAMAAMFGYDTPQDMLEGVTDIAQDIYVEPATRSKFLKILKQDGKVNKFECQMKRKGGKTFWAYLNARAMNQGDFTYIDGFVEDITERVDAAREAHEREQQLIQADKMISLGILTAGVAHEINNPNNFIMLNAPILSDTWNSALPVLEDYYSNNGDFIMGGIAYSEMRDYVPKLLSGISEGAERIMRIVRNMKDFARQDSSGMSMSVDLHGVVDEALTLLGNKIKKSTGGVRRHRAPNLPRVSGNHQRLEQVLVNLILNAAEATSDQTKPIRIASGVNKNKKTVVLTIRDFGCGMAPDDMKRVFDPFFTTKRDLGGIGLGLSISSSIVKAHGGTLRFVSRPGRGTTAILSLPMDERPREARQ